MNYTPGPWEAMPRNGGGFEVLAKSPHVPGKVQVVATINGPWVRDNYASNAKLVAAAPELLEACRQAIITLDPMDKDHFELYHILREALDKATR